jgi:hypothetical protein
MRVSALWIALGVLSGGALLAVPFPGGAAVDRDDPNRTRKRPLDLSSYPDTPPASRRSLLFIHHSVGGNLLADPGVEKEAGGRDLYVSHPKGGGLRAKLQAQGYAVHEASRGSVIGDATDTLDWLPKFRDHMDTLLKVDTNDVPMTDGRRHDIVVFKSCFTDLEFVGEGTAPGDPRGPERTLWNFKAQLAALLPEFQKHPEVLFVYMTPPPLSPVVDRQPLWKVLARKVLGRPSAGEALARRAALSREFSEWAVSSEGWLKDYPLKNVVVFDYYGVLTDGTSSLARYVPEDGDSHPTSAGNRKAAEAFVPFLNRSVRRAGL